MACFDDTAEVMAMPLIPLKPLFLRVGRQSRGHPLQGGDEGTSNGRRREEVSQDWAI